MTPAWLKILLDTGEFLALGLYFRLLNSRARRSGTDSQRRTAVQRRASIECRLFVVFTVLFFTVGIPGLPYQVFGVLYLITLVVGMTISVQMRQTLETLEPAGLQTSIATNQAV